MWKRTNAGWGIRDPAASPLTEELRLLSARKIVDVPGGAFVRDDLAGVAEDDGTGWDVEVDVGAGGDQCVIADGYIADDDGVCTDPDPVSQSGSPFVRAPAGSTDGDALADVDVAPQHCERADDDAAKVTDKEAWANPGIGRDIKAIPEAVVLKKRAVIEEHEKTRTAPVSGEEGKFAKVAGKPKAGLVQPRIPKGTTAYISPVPVQIGVQRVFQFRVQEASRSKVPCSTRCVQQTFGSERNQPEVLPHQDFIGFVQATAVEEPWRTAVMDGLDGVKKYVHAAMMSSRGVLLGRCREAHR